MTRSMVTYQYLADAQARNATLRKRKPSLFKKMTELKRMCDVDACLVMYEKVDSPPDVWPSPPEALRVMQRFENSRLVGINAMLNQKTFLQKNISRMQKHLEKEKGKNLKLSMVRCAFDEDAIGENDEEDLEGMCALLECEIKMIDLMIKNAFEKIK